MSAPGIREKVAFLSGADIYPEATSRVDVKETHMSWVFLTDTNAWKLKKPVRYDYLDFSTPDARRRNCEEEVRLNRRLAPDVYLGVVPLTIDSQRKLTLGGQGQPVDWLVRMRRLPSDRMLDQAIADHTWTDEDLHKVGVLLARFYEHSPPIPMSAAEYQRRLSSELRNAQSELTRSEHALPGDLVNSVVSTELRCLEMYEKLFTGRVRNGRIIEAHGDLRPEHICLEPQPVIIDCLEFNRDFRILDPASELSFLALECERLGAPRPGELLLKTYGIETGDRLPRELMAFYKSYHACVRAKIAIWHLRDHDPLSAPKWTNKAIQYLQLASSVGQRTTAAKLPDECVPHWRR
jgi:aminoglycoside phosphotransferase family enzyme